MLDFLGGFNKVAVVDLPDDARAAAVMPVQDYSPGSMIEKETGQRQMSSARSPGVLREGREFAPKYKRSWKNARQP